MVEKKGGQHKKGLRASAKGGVCASGGLELIAGKLGILSFKTALGRPGLPVLPSDLVSEEESKNSLAAFVDSLGCQATSENTLL
ncbi:hypothetical protein Efla_007412 [Eimeria flavescens]